MSRPSNKSPASYKVPVRPHRWALVNNFWIALNYDVAKFNLDYRKVAKQYQHKQWCEFTHCFVSFYSQFSQSRRQLVDQINASTDEPECRISCVNNVKLLHRVTCQMLRVTTRRYATWRDKLTRAYPTSSHLNLSERSHPENARITELNTNADAVYLHEDSSQLPISVY